MKRVIFLLLLSFFAIQISKAQIYLRNNTNDIVYVAFSIYKSSKSSKAWYSEGWFKAEPGDKIILNKKVGAYPNVYYYAVSANNVVYEGTSSFLVKPKDHFSIKNADKDYKKKENAKYKWRSFRHVKIKNSSVKLWHTIELNPISFGDYFTKSGTLTKMSVPSGANDNYISSYAIKFNNPITIRYGNGKKTKMNVKTILVNFRSSKYNPKPLLNRNITINGKLNLRGGNVILEDAYIK